MNPRTKRRGFFIWFHRPTDRTGRYERSDGGSNPSGTTKGEIRAVWTKLGALEMRRPSRCLGSSPSFSAKKTKHMESKPGRSLAPPAKRVARFFGWASTALLSATWKMNCSGLQPCLENSGYLRVLGSTPTSSATGKLSLMVMGSAWKARRTARYTVRFRSFPQTKSKLFRLLSIKYTKREKNFYIYSTSKGKKPIFVE